MIKLTEALEITPYVGCIRTRRGERRFTPAGFFFKDRNQNRSAKVRDWLGGDL
jgi:hypothetical protein